MIALPKAEQWTTRLPTLLGLALLTLTIIGLPTAQAQPPEPVPRVGVADLEDLAATIEDAGTREQLLARIRTLIAAKRSSQDTPPGTSAGGRLSAALSDNLTAASRQFRTATDALRRLPALFASVRDQATDPASRQRWLTLIFMVALILIVSGIAERVLRWLLRRPRQALEEREVDNLGVRVSLLAGRTALDLVPIAAFAAAYAVVPVVHAAPQVQIMALTLIKAYLIVGGTLVVARMLLTPAATSLRVLPLRDETANYLFIWVRRLVSFSVFGFFLAEAALLLGLPADTHTGLLHLLALAITGLLIVFVLQNQEPVAAWIRGDGTDRAAGVRARFADIWHVLAVTYITAVFGVWVLGIAGGFQYLARATGTSIVILVVARLIVTGLDRSMAHGFAIGAQIRDRFPALEERANRYLPALHLCSHWTVGLIAALALLQSWGVDALAWLDTPLGHQLGGRAMSIIAVVVLAVVFWEVVDAAIERYLRQSSVTGNVIERSARMRTLLPLLRKTVFTVLAVMVTLIVLSEVGINIGPLLAGAGVVGLAVGFGAQTLVKDVITGLFILIEDTVAVGDYVELGGHEGTVESLSIRTISLRDPAGSVHTVPFSEAGTVLNYTKDFSNVVLNIGIAYRENVDDVMKVIENLGREMAEDRTLAPDILRPLEVQGLQSLDDSAVVIRARIRVRAGTQWGIKREFNRRMKNRFDELGIEIPFPQRAITFGEDREGKAVPGRIVLEEKRTTPEAPGQLATKGKARLVQDRGDEPDGDSGG